MYVTGSEESEAFGPNVRERKDTSANGVAVCLREYIGSSIILLDTMKLFLFAVNSRQVPW